jgi:enoyl-CoA hydratase/carnithine racemase
MNAIENVDVATAERIFSDLADPQAIIQSRSDEWRGKLWNAVEDVLVPQDRVRAAALSLAQEIAECSPLGLLSTRATMRAGLADRIKAATDHELIEQNRLRRTDDSREGVKSTAERRPANFLAR